MEIEVKGVATAYARTVYPPISGPLTRGGSFSLTSYAGDGLGLNHKSFIVQQMVECVWEGGRRRAGEGGGKGLP
jgi:hypothetical protein